MIKPGGSRDFLGGRTGTTPASSASGDAPMWKQSEGESKTPLEAAAAAQNMHIGRVRVCFVPSLAGQVHVLQTSGCTDPAAAPRCTPGLAPCPPKCPCRHVLLGSNSFIETKKGSIILKASNPRLWNVLLEVRWGTDRVVKNTLENWAWTLKGNLLCNFYRNLPTSPIFSFPPPQPQEFQAWRMECWTFKLLTHQERITKHCRILLPNIIQPFKERLELSEGRCAGSKSLSPQGLLCYSCRFW